MPDHDSTDYAWGQTNAEIRSLRNDLTDHRRYTDERLNQIGKDLELLKRISYAIMGAVTVANLAGPILSALGK